MRSAIKFRIKWVSYKQDNVQLVSYLFQIFFFLSLPYLEKADLKKKVIIVKLPRQFSINGEKMSRNKQCSDKIVLNETGSYLTAA